MSYVEVVTKQAFETFIDSNDTRIKKIEDKVFAVSPPVPVQGKTGFYWAGYVSPSSTVWDTVINKKKAFPTVPFLVAINPASGVGSSKNTALASRVTAMQAVGIIVIGYVYTSYGNRSQAVIQNEINLYKQWYNINGIFFDEMANTQGLETYYSALNAYTKSQISNGFTMGNPGTDSRASYVGTMDNLIIYERAGLPTLDSLKGWHTSFDKKNFSIIPYGVATLTSQQVKDYATVCGWLYITNDTLPNPWDSLSIHTDTIVNALV